jgi:glycosyltransferase involved in cell wall biosynthesis
MKILFSSHTFFPNIGGLESVSLLLAREFTRAGDQVKLITQTPVGPSEPSFPFEVIRQPSVVRLLQLTAWADVVFHNNISLRTAWPLLFTRKPWVVTHQTWIPRTVGIKGLRNRFKRLALRSSTEIAISEAIAEDFSGPCLVIPNPYDDDVFKFLPNNDRNKELIFVGRLVSSKGADILIRSVANINKQGLRPALTIVGHGPEEKALKKLSLDLHLDQQIQFVGPKRGKELAAILNRHRILVVPSLWQEPFGVVALEGIACGCVVVGSEGGGLKEAIGLCGCTFPNGDPGTLSAILVQLLTQEHKVDNFRHHALLQVESHRPTFVAHKYSEIFKGLQNFQRGYL